MVTSIARQSVILKCKRKESVLLGNYELYYLAGVLKQTFSLSISEEMEPAALTSEIKKQIEGLTSEDENISYLLKMVSVYEPMENYDDQMKELFLWGLHEEDLFLVMTSHSGKEYLA